MQKLQKTKTKSKIKQPHKNSTSVHKKYEHPQKNPKKLNWFKSFVGNQDHCEECYHMWNIRLFSQLYRVQTHVCIYFLIFQFGVFIHYLKKRLIGSTVLYLQSLLLGLEVAVAAAAVQTGMFLCWATAQNQLKSPHYGSSALCSPAGFTWDTLPVSVSRALTVGRGLLCNYQGREHKFFYMYLFEFKRFWSVQVELQ